MVEDNTFSHLIVVGASAGGIEALTRLVTTLPEDLPAPIVIAQHLDPERASHLEQILSRSSTLPCTPSQITHPSSQPETSP